MTKVYYLILIDVYDYGVMTMLIFHDILHFHWQVIVRRLPKLICASKTSKNGKFNSHHSFGCNFVSITSLDQEHVLAARANPVICGLHYNIEDSDP